MSHRPRRILFIENSIALGGSTVSLCGLLSALDRGAYLPYVVLSRETQERFLRTQGDIAKEVRVIARRPSLQVCRLGKASVALVGKLSVRLQRLLLSAIAGLDMLFVTAPYVARLFLFARRCRPDLIEHNNGFDPAAVFLKLLLHIPLVAYQRGWEWNSFTVRQLAKVVDRWVANSETIREHLLELGVERERTDVIYPPVDLARFDRRPSCLAQRREFGMREGEQCFGMLGALREHRGQRAFLKAASTVITAVPNCRAFIIGAAPVAGVEFERELRTLARELGVQDRVVFTGYRSDVPELMQMLDVVVHPAQFTEPFGRVIAEAMAMAKPVVATIGGGPSELIRDGYNGFLVPRGDETMLAKRVVALLTDPTLAQRLGQHGHEQATAKFSAPMHALLMQQVYAKVLGIQDGDGLASQPGRHANDVAVAPS